LVTLVGIEPVFLKTVSYVRTLPEQPPPSLSPGGGRGWWAHLVFTRINIALTITKNQVEDLHEAHE
jgi:hypothetical protein